MSKSIVHNHGPEDGPGLSCREYITPAGVRRGTCLGPVSPRHRAYMTQPTAIEELRARLTGIADGHGRHRDITRLPAAPSLGCDPELDEVRAELDTPVDVSGVTL